MKKIGVFIPAFVIIAIFIFAVCQASTILRVKDDCGKNKQLIEGDDEYDVFLLGTSHMARIQPMELWQQGGITSYNIYNIGYGMSRYWATLELALDYKTPKLVVIDTDEWWKSTSFEEEPGDFHRAFRLFPFSFHKARIVMNLVKDRSAQFELLFDLWRYHGRFHELKADDFDDPQDCCLGAHPYFRSNPQVQPVYDAVNVDTEEPSEEGELYLRKIIELCRSRNIDVMLTCLPFCASDEAWQKQQEIYRLADEYNITFCNFLDKENVLNYNTDFEDGGHMNLSGARKITPLLIDLLRTDYGITDHRNEPQVAERWNAKVIDYYSFMESYVGKSDETDLKSMMIMMSLPHYCGEIYVKNYQTGILNFRGVIDLLQNITYCELPGAKEAAERGDNYLLVYNRLANVVQEYHGDAADQMIGPDAGNAMVALRDAGTMELVYEYHQKKN